MNSGKKYHDNNNYTHVKDSLQEKVASKNSEEKKRRRVDNTPSNLSTQIPKWLLEEQYSTTGNYKKTQQVASSCMLKDCDSLVPYHTTAPGRHSIISPRSIDKSIRLTTPFGCSSPFRVSGYGYSDSEYHPANSVAGIGGLKPSTPNQVNYKNTVESNLQCPNLNRSVQPQPQYGFVHLHIADENCDIHTPATPTYPVAYYSANRPTRHSNVLRNLSLNTIINSTSASPLTPLSSSYPIHPSSSNIPSAFPVPETTAIADNPSPELSSRPILIEARPITFDGSSTKHLDNFSASPFQCLTQNASTRR